MKDKMRICPKAGVCIVKSCIAQFKHNYSSMCTARTKGKAFLLNPQDEPSQCPACIPVEPEKVVITDSMFAVKNAAKQAHNLAKALQEPQPATCPDCGHPVSMHDVVDGCMQKLPFAKDSYSYCSCDKFPADQPEKQCAGCPNPSDNYNCPSKEDCPEQPTPTMPLREQFAEILYGDKEVATAYEVYPLFTKTLNQLMKKVEAHDSAVAAQAVKEFAEKVIKVLPYVTQGEVVRIRAMAEGKE